jgi:hypothetical protein
LSIVVAMQLLRVLVRLPDRPGSLGRVTTLLGRLGIDIEQVRILSRDGTAATDEFILSISGPVVQSCLVDLLEEIDGVRVLGTWPMPPLPAPAPPAAELIG